MQPYVFVNTLVTKSVGFGYARFGYIRLTFCPLDRWIKSGNYMGAGLRSWLDNYGPMWQGWSFKGCSRGGEWLSFRWYRRIATHASVGPFTLSYVNDREAYGPIGSVWPRDARKRKKASQEVAA